MKIGIIDADLLGRVHHKMPNLALMKLSNYHKKLGDSVDLIHYDDLNKSHLFTSKFDKVYLAKVFTDTPYPEFILKLPFVEYGGTGFFFDKSPRLPLEIEHTMPDYHLYDKWVRTQIMIKGRRKSFYEYFTDFSIGFTTRGCFRQCKFCINQNEKKVYLHSPLSEFVDNDRKSITLFDDNILGYPKCNDIIRELQATKKTFEFKQGLDIRLLTDEKAKLLGASRYSGNITFAFDNIKDKSLIEKKLTLFLPYAKHDYPSAILYCFCCFDENNIYDDTFWIKDIFDLFERIKILMEHYCSPYIMMFEKHKESPYEYIYLFMRNWCNSMRLFKKQSFREYLAIYCHDKRMYRFMKNNPELVEKYFDLKYKRRKQNEQTTIIKSIRNGQTSIS